MSHTRTARRAAFVATIAVGAVVLAACSSSTSGGTAADTSGDAPTGVTLTMWHNSGDSQALLDLYSAYEAASGNTIELVDLPSDTYPTAVQTKWATGERPDLMEYMPSPQDMAQLNMSENMIDLSSLSFVDAAGSLTDVAGSLDGKVYGAVLGPVATFGAFYNKDVFGAAGLEVPTDYAELQEDCTALAATGATPVFVGGGSEFPSMMIPGFTYMADFNSGDAWGQSIASGEATVNQSDSPLLAGLTVLDDLRTSGCLNSDAGTATADDAVAAVSSGKAALTVLPSDYITPFYAAGSDEAAVDATVGFAPISAKDGVSSFSAGSYGTFFAPITGDDTKQRAAVDFIDWITTDGYQDYIDAANSVSTLSTATTPALTGMYQSMAEMLQASTTTVAFNNSIPGFGNFGTIAGKVLVGQSTPQEAADSFQTFIDQAIAAQQ